MRAAQRSPKGAGCWKICGVACSNMQFLTLNQHIIIKFSSQCPVILNKNFIWGRPLTWGGCAPFSSTPLEPPPTPQYLCFSGLWHDVAVCVDLWYCAHSFSHIVCGSTHCQTSCIVLHSGLLIFTVMIDTTTQNVTWRKLVLVIYCCRCCCRYY